MNACGFCHKKGHSESFCFEKHGPPEKNTCTNCKNIGHLEKECRRKVFDESRTTNDNPPAGPLVLKMCDTHMENSDMWIADSDVSHHMTNSPDGMVNCREADKPITQANGEPVSVKFMGDVNILLKNECTSMKETILLENVGYIPSL